MVNPRITVLLPVFNAMPWLRQAMESLLAQSFVDFELLAINDGSQDESLACLQAFAQTDSRVRLISRENRGLIATLNQGLDLAQGEYVARMDADDLCHLDRLRVQLLLMDERNLDICGCQFQLIDETGKLLSIYSVPESQSGCWAYLASTPPFAHGAVMLRRSFLERNNLRYGQGCFRYAEDYAFWAQCALAGARMGNTCELLYYYRLTSVSLARSRQQAIFRDTSGISRLVLDQAESQVQDALLRELKERNTWASREQLILFLGAILLIVRGSPYSMFYCLCNFSIASFFRAFALWLKRYAFLRPRQ